MIQIINDLAYTRLSGSQNDEVRCKDYLIKRYKELGVEPVLEKVDFSDFSTNVLLRVIVAIMCVGLAVGLVLEWLDFPWINLVLIVGLISSLLMAVNLQRTKTDMFARMGRMQETFNIHAQVAGSNPGSGPRGIKHVVFVGHHDSKSQTVTTLIRTVSYVFGMLLSLVLGLLFIISSLLKVLSILGAVTTFKWLATVIFIIDLSFMVILLMNKTIEGKSLGSLDNATAIAIVLKLLEHYKSVNPAGLNTWFLITGAEEWGMVGAIKFWDTYGKEKGMLSAKDTVFINFDMVAGGFRYLDSVGMPKARYAMYINDVIVRAAKELGLEARPFWLPVPLGTTDGWIFHSKGCETADIINSGMARYTHSARDTPAVCDGKTLEDAVAITKRVVEILATE